MPATRRLRALVADTLDQGWWRLLWMPASLPYVVPGGPYSDPNLAGMTKRLVFSSWTATPTAVAAILSYEAERRMAQGTNYSRYTPENRRRLAKHLQYPLRGGVPARMATLLVQWPMAELAAVTNPLDAVAERAGAPLTVPELRAWAAVRVEALVTAQTHLIDSSGDASSAELREDDWRAAFALAGNWPDEDESSDEALSFLLSGRQSEDGEEEAEDPTGLTAHIAQARTALAHGPKPVDDATISWC